MTTESYDNCSLLGWATKLDGLSSRMSSHAHSKQEVLAYLQFERTTHHKHSCTFIRPAFVHSPAFPIASALLLPWPAPAGLTTAAAQSALLGKACTFMQVHKIRAGMCMVKSRSALLRTACTRVVKFEVRPKVWVRELSRILTNLKPFGVRSKFDKLLRVCQILQHASVKIARDSSPPLFSPTFSLQ